MTEKEFVEKIGPLATEDMMESGILASTKIPLCRKFTM